MSSDADKAMANLQKKFSLGVMYGKQNEHMINSLQKTFSVTLALVAQHGLTILNVSINDSKALITVEHIRDGDFFHWDTKFNSVCPRTSAVITWGAKEFKGVLVQWEIKGALH